MRIYLCVDKYCDDTRIVLATASEAVAKKWLNRQSVDSPAEVYVQVFELETEYNDGEAEDFLYRETA